MDPQKRQARFNAKRQAVILSAAKAFRRRGYHNTSMSDIAKSLGLTKPALYYYVSTKEEILFECHMLIYAAMQKAIKNNTKSGTGLKRLKSLYGDFVRLLTKDGLALLADIDSLKGDNQKQVLQKRDKIENSVTKLVKQGIQDGSIAKRDAKITVYFLMGALNWLNVWYETDGRVSGEDITNTFVRQMADGIKA